MSIRKTFSPDFAKKEPKRLPIAPAPIIVIFILPLLLFVFDSSLCVITPNR